MRIAASIALLSLIYGSVAGYVFSCEEVKYQLVNANREISAKTICVIPEAGFSIDNLKKIYAQNDKVSTNFADIATNGDVWTLGCMDRVGDNPWRIVADEPVNLDCTKEFSLIFKSSQDHVVQVGGTISSSGAIVFVAPRTGIKLHLPQCDGSGNLTIHTGAGNGVAEFRYPMKSWRCADLPKWIVSFDNVITITSDSGSGFDGLQHSKHDYSKPITVSSTDRVAVMSSGRSDNLQNLRTEQNVATFSAGANVVAAADISSSFDSRYDGFLTITGDGDSWTQQYRNVSFHTDFPVAQSIKVDYGSKTIPAQGIWDSQDNFVVEFKLSEAVMTPPSYCGCELDKKFDRPIDWLTTEIWIDMVIILDCTEAMGQQSLISAIGLIQAFVGDEFKDVLMTDVNAKFYTRIGLIAMSDTIEVIYSLNMTKYDDISEKVHLKKGVINVDVVGAFKAALTMFNSEMRNDRKDTRRVIYYITNSDPIVNTAVMSQFKASQGTIIVNDFIQEGTVGSPRLKELASDGYYGDNLQDDYMQSVQLFCKANCYCLSDKKAYAGANPDPAVHAAGGCFYANPNSLPWNSAKAICAQQGNGGLLVSLHDDDKAQFAKQLLKSITSKDYFWFGYSKSDDGSWKWEDKSTDPDTNWNIDEPNPISVAQCAYADMTTENIFWGSGNCQAGFPSVCEFPPCMAGNKC